MTGPGDEPALVCPNRPGRPRLIQIVDGAVANRTRTSEGAMGRLLLVIGGL